MTKGPVVVAEAPDPDAFSPFGSFIMVPDEVGGRAHFESWLEPVPDRTPSYHLNRVAPTALPVTVHRVERHPHAPQLFLPVGVSRYLVIVMPSDATGAPDPTRACSFEVPGTMGVAYRPGVWHAGISVLDAEGSFAVMMWRGGEGDDDFEDIAPLTVGAPPPAPGADDG